jgi:hypothetical protein
MNNDERLAIEAWVDTLTAELNLAGLPLSIDDILNLAGTAARVIVRPAAPLTTFIVGYAAGYAAATGTEPEVALRELVAATDRFTADHEASTQVGG